MAELHNRWFKGQAVHAELSCLLSPTFGSHAVGSMRWGMAFQGYDGLLESQTPVYVLGRGAVSDNSLLRPSIFNPGNVPMVASATSCTCDPSPGISGSSSLGRDPGTVPQDQTALSLELSGCLQWARGASSIPASLR